jgi:putative endonuclease
MLEFSLSEEKRFYTYIVRCADDTLYTGWTVDLGKRIEAHNNGSGAKYTRKRAPVSLAMSWEFESKVEAMRAEYAIKQLPKKQKLDLISGKLEAPLV